MKQLAYATCIGMFIVVLNGALVTKTGSGMGCGSDWPLCNGKFVPAYTIESMIEYSHRFVTGIVGLLVLASFIFVLRAARDKRDALSYAFLTLLFTVIQAIMGALAVVFTQSPPVMALHFGISLLAFASSFLLCVVLRRYERGRAVQAAQGRPIRAEFRYGVWFTLLYTYIVIYVGAFVRHTDSSGGCMGWPLCNGEWIPDLTGGTAIAFWHRVAAALLLIVVAVMAHFAYHNHKDNREIQLCGIWAVALCAAQIISGAFVVLAMLDANLFLVASLLHTTLISGLFSVLCHMSIRVWQLRSRSLTYIHDRKVHEL
ncbi:COX15/CtaA family protein [Paenibacillus apiarius]|uniref:COX15/CtaA family protein n=1 Tax=Paenibacillus apiarius TaxID=46240 RepID=UPI00197E657C|nr:heme A synthase [Paenibacillus apiarius]MBN3525473.1 heme A synthase [Paenibacillus apiarius]